MRRIWSNAPEYVAGVDRAFWPIGEASICTTWRMPPRSRRRTCPGSAAPLSDARAAGMRLSRTRAVFPAPDGPASAVSRPAGKAAVRSCRLYRSPISTVTRDRPERAASGGEITIEIGDLYNLHDLTAARSGRSRVTVVSDLPGPPAAAAPA